jgi:hypothetical protein
LSSHSNQKLVYETTDRIQMFAIHTLHFHFCLWAGQTTQLVARTMPEAEKYNCGSTITRWQQGIVYCS